MKKINTTSSASKMIEKSGTPPLKDIMFLKRGMNSITADYIKLLKAKLFPVLDELEKAEAELKATKITDSEETEEERKLRAEQIERQKADAEEKAKHEQAKAKVELAEKKMIIAMKQIRLAITTQTPNVASLAKKLGLTAYKKTANSTDRIWTGGVEQIPDIDLKNVLARDRKLNDIYRKRVKKTQALITSLKPDGHKRLTKIVNQAVQERKTNLRKQIAPLIRKEALRTNETIDNRAQLIAVDQMHSYTADLTEERNKSVGITHYIWRSSKDDRVRPQDADLDGQRFAYADPPKGGNPGQKIRCRCTAEPDLSTIGTAPVASKPKKRAVAKPAPVTAPKPVAKEIVEPAPVVEPEPVVKKIVEPFPVAKPVPVAKPAPVTAPEPEVKEIVEPLSSGEKFKRALLSAPDIDPNSPEAIWAQNLDGDEEEAIMEWGVTDYDPIRRAQASNFDLERHNRMFKEEWEVMTYAQMAGWKRRSQIIEKALKKAPLYQKDIYRGLSVDPNVAKVSFVEGARIDTRSIASWSKSKDIAEGFAAGEAGTVDLDVIKTNTQIVMHLKGSDTGVSDITGLGSISAGDQEVLMDRGKVLEIVKVEGDGKILRVEVKEVIIDKKAENADQIERLETMKGILERDLKRLTAIGARGSIRKIKAQLNRTNRKIKEMGG